ncbi:MAG: hypothetical protein IMZ44_08325 [Planctomycetes bacterium]|nr:hypothetical protein [Planctomycetota bacterium]
MNVTALVNASGAVVERYVYDPYGKVTILDGTTGGQTEWAADADQKSDVDNEILYCGYRFDPESGLYHVRHRSYHPTLGRWRTRADRSGVGGSAFARGWRWCGGLDVGQDGFPEFVQVSLPLVAHPVVGGGAAGQAVDGAAQPLALLAGVARQGLLGPLRPIARLCEHPRQPIVHHAVKLLLHRVAVFVAGPPQVRQEHVGQGL